MADVFNDLKNQSYVPLADYNTDTIYDYVTGTPVPGKDGSIIVSGGFPNLITGVQALGNSFKSTLLTSLMMRSASLYPGARAILDDTESAVTRAITRVLSFMHPYLLHDLGANFLFLRGCDYNLTEFYNKTLELIEERCANIKDYIRESPMIDPYTGKFIKCYVPLYLFVDSLTEARTVSGGKIADKADIGDSGQNTLFMGDGKDKTIYMQQMRSLCEKHGIILILSGHVGDKLNMSGYGPPPKDTPFMKQGQTPKGVGSKWLTLCASLSQIFYVGIKASGAKTALYPMGNTPDKDINGLSVGMIRCKTQASGYLTEFIVSQSKGLLPVATDYNYLKSEKQFGMSGTLQTQEMMLYPGTKIQRTNVRQKAAADYKLERALQLTAQLLYVQKHWNLVGLGDAITTVTPDALFKKLDNSKSLSVDSVLESRGYWTYDTKAPREYMSIFDVVNRLDKD